jgi:hypothetical protein
MKTYLYTLLLGAGLLQLHAQSPQSESASKVSDSTTVTAESGIVAKEGQMYLIQNNQALRLEKDSLPEGKMLNGEGVLVPLPANLTGFDAAGDTAPPATSATAATVDPASTGITMRGGSLFMVRNGQARPVDTAALGDSLMMTLDGRQVPIPDNLDFKSAGTIKPGSITPGRVEGANVKGADVRGADVKGADVQGSSVRGADVKGPDVKGPDVSR